LDRAKFVAVLEVFYKYPNQLRGWSIDLRASSWVGDDVDQEVIIVIYTDGTIEFSSHTGYANILRSD
jgi:hypothetical protein